MEATLSKLAEVVTEASDLETLARPMLELLEEVTGFESTYLTSINETAGVQNIEYSRNSSELNIAEGLMVPWHDTLCKRALEEGRSYTDDVDACWGDSDAARELGIKTYLSQPVHTLDGTLYGTLCAASSRKVELPAQSLRVLQLFARIVAQQLDQQQLVHALKTANVELSAHASTDPLTGIPNRRALTDHLTRLLQASSRNQSSVTVAFVDLNGFKAVNDEYGHDIGDRFLTEMAKRLCARVRAGDFVARYGGDEFVVVAPDAEPEQLRERLASASSGDFQEDGISIPYAAASIGIVVSNPAATNVNELLKQADAAMYAVKEKTRPQ